MLFSGISKGRTKWRFSSFFSSFFRRFFVVLDGDEIVVNLERADKRADKRGYLFALSHY